MEIFCGFRLLEYALWQETKTRKRRKSTKAVLNQKTLIVNSYHYQETAEKLHIWYVCTILTSRTRETLFKLHYNVDVDNFDQYFESFAINTHSAQKSAVNNSVNNLKKLTNYDFPCFPGFRICCIRFFCISSTFISNTRLKLAKKLSKG